MDSAAEPAQSIPDALRKIAAQVRQGERPVVSVRALLGWFYAERRGHWIVSNIRSALDYFNLKTEPDFQGAYIDGEVTFVPVDQASSDGGSAPPAPEEIHASHGADAWVSAPTVEAAVPIEANSFELELSRDPTYRIGKLKSANTRPVSVVPHSTLSEAITIMLKYDFSQLPVMTSDREVKGLVSWRSIGSRLSLGRKVDLVRDCTDAHHEVSADTSLFSAISLVVDHECVLVRDSTNKICGIVTISDLGVQFGQLSEPFLLLGEAENHIRDFMRDKFKPEQLREIRDPGDPSREIQDVSDLTLGEYLRLLENPEGWERLGIRIDRKAFVKDLDQIRRIRNDVMHFDPDSIGEDDLADLRRFVRFLQRLRYLSSPGH